MRSTAALLVVLLSFVGGCSSRERNDPRPERTFAADEDGVRCTATLVEDPGLRENNVRRCARAVSLDPAPDLARADALDWLFVQLEPGVDLLLERTLVPHPDADALMQRPPATVEDALEVASRLLRCEARAELLALAAERASATPVSLGIFVEAVASGWVFEAPARGERRPGGDPLLARARALVAVAKRKDLASGDARRIAAALPEVPRERRAAIASALVWGDGLSVSDALAAIAALDPPEPELLVALLRRPKISEAELRGIANAIRPASERARERVAQGLFAHDPLPFAELLALVATLDDGDRARWLGALAREKELDASQARAVARATRGLDPYDRADVLCRLVGRLPDALLVEEAETLDEEARRHVTDAIARAQPRKG